MRAAGGSESSQPPGTDSSFSLLPTPSARAIILFLNLRDNCDDVCSFLVS